jgi:hypothetical protein
VTRGTRERRTGWGRGGSCTHDELGGVSSLLRTSYQPEQDELSNCIPRSVAGADGKFFYRGNFRSDLCTLVGSGLDREQATTEAKSLTHAD